MYRYILFDLDGTLTDSGEGITKSVAYAIEKMGFPALPQSTLLKFIGPPLTESYPDRCGMNREETDRAIAYFHERFDTVGIWENYPIPGMRELLAELCEKGYKLALASSKPKHAATDICEKFGFAPYLSVIGGNDEDLGARAKWEIIQQVVEFFGVSDKSEVLMVGDRKYDCIGAAKCGVDCAGLAICEYGEEGELEAHGAVTVAKTVEELREFIFTH